MQELIADAAANDGLKVGDTLRLDALTLRLLSLFGEHKSLSRVLGPDRRRSLVVGDAPRVADSGAEAAVEDQRMARHE